MTLFVPQAASAPATRDPELPGAVPDSELPSLKLIENPPIGWGIYSAFLRAKHDIPANWEPYSFNCSDREAPAGYLKVEGGYFRLLKSGKRKGQKTWDGRDKKGDKTYYIKFDDLKQFAIEHATALGVCPKCWGEGRTWARIAFTKDGVDLYRPCKVCNGTGKPAPPSPSERRQA